MAPTIRQVLLGIEARLATIPGLQTSPVMPDQITPPAAFVGLPAIPNYHATMGRGRFDLEPTVTVLVSATISKDGQLALADYANPTGTTSVLAALESDRTLGGVVEDCIVIDFRPLGMEEVGLIGYFGGVFTLRAIASGV